MYIQNGKLYENRTWRYLYPSLKVYGATLMNHLASFIKLAVGIGDAYVETTEPCIFILIDTNRVFPTEAELMAYKLKFAKFINWIRYQYFYVTDYIYDGLDSGGEKHMVVLKLPHKFDMSYFHFVNGEYSKMYTPKEVNEYFKLINMPQNLAVQNKVNERIKTTRAILKKESSYIPTFAKKVNEMFGTDNPESDFIDAELDFPPNFDEEVFNYREYEEC